MPKTNIKKTKMMIFQERKRKYDPDFYIGNEKSDIVSHLPDILHPC